MHFEERQKEKNPLIYEFKDEKISLHAYIVIDSLRNGNSCGGLRISEDLNVEEIKALARNMTLKYCFLKLNVGGAKSGIILPKNCTASQRTEILAAFGKKASPLLVKRTYIPWTDLNSTVEDIATILKAAGCNFRSMSDSAYFTALSVVSAVKAACDVRKIDLQSMTVIIEGFGGVGLNIASELSNLGAKIIGISTVKGALYNPNGLNVKKLLQLKTKHKDDLVFHYGEDYLEKKELLLEMNTDILIPCARTWSINEKNMEKIKAKIIVPGANVPLAEGIEKFFYNKEIVYLPDFVCNLGGIFGTALYDYGNRKNIVHDFIMDDFNQLVKRLILASYSKCQPPSSIAQSIAKMNCQNNNQFTQEKSWMNKFFSNTLHKNIDLKLLIPGYQAKKALRDQKKIFIENIQFMTEI